MKLKELKNKFADREIQPSVGSWEKLSERLDGQQRKSKKPILLWLSAAAAILILALLVVSSLGDNEQIESSTQQMVMEENQPSAPENSQTNNPVNEIVEKSTIPAEGIANRVKPATNKTQQSSRVATPSQLEEPSLELDQAVAQMNTISKEESTATFIVAEEIDLNSVKESMNAMEEANALLNQAMNQYKPQQQDAIAVKPSRLLRETEWDLQDRKRNRLENTLLDGLGILKKEAVALIDRN